MRHNRSYHYRVSPAASYKKNYLVLIKPFYRAILRGLMFDCFFRLPSTLNRRSNFSTSSATTDTRGKEFRPSNNAKMPQQNLGEFKFVVSVRNTQTHALTRQ